MKPDMRRCPWCGRFDGSEEVDGELWHSVCWDREQKERDEARKEREQ
jgi:hypothetical protein